MIYLFDRKKKLQKVLPRKNIISATQTVELNGLYQLSVEVPLFYETKEGTIYNHQKHVEKAWFAGHYDKQKRFQLYKIHTRKIKADNQEILIFDGVHIFFDEAKAMGNIHDRRFRDSEMKPAADMAFNSIGWYIKDYDVTDRHDINFYRSTVADAKADIIETYGVEFDYGLTFDGRKIISKDLYIKKRIGQWTGKRFAYGTNLMSLEKEQDESEVYTAAVGRGKGEEAGEGHGPRLEFTDIEWSKDGITKPTGQNWIELPDATAEYGFYEDGEIMPRFAPAVEFSEVEDKKILADNTYNWLLENSVPKAQWKTDVAKSDIHNLGDGVAIIYKKAGVVKTARVHKMENNILDEQLSKITLGDYGHFKTDKRQQRIDSEIKQNRNDTDSYITQMKNDFDARYEEQETAIDNAYEQAVIDAEAEVEAAEERMTNDLDSFKGEHQNLYDEVTGNVKNIDDFLGDKSGTLQERFEDVQADLNAVGDDLGEAKKDLQGQLDEAQAELEGIEVGGRNLLLNSGELKTMSGGGSPTFEYLDEYKGKKNVVKITNPGRYIIFDPTEQYSETYEIGNIYTASFSAMYEGASGNTPTLYMGTGNNGYQPVEGEMNKENFTRLNRTFAQESDASTMRMHFDFSGYETVYFAMDIQVEKGNTPTDWTPAPEDTEAKITDINTSVTELENGLQAKLEQTDIEPLQNTITEHSNTLEVTTTDISALQDKTELHDGDITKWSNETVSNAEEINTALSRVSDTEDGLEQAQLDITANADELALTASQSDLNSATGRIENVETDISVEAGRIDALTSKTDGHETQIGSLETSFDEISGTVTNINNDYVTQGQFKTLDDEVSLRVTEQQLESTVDGLQYDNNNLLQYTDFRSDAAVGDWYAWLNTVTSVRQEEIDSKYYLRIGISPDVQAGDNPRIRTPYRYELETGQTYTASWIELHSDWVSDTPYAGLYVNSVIVNSFNGAAREVIGEVEYQGYTRNVYRYTHTFVFNGNYQDPCAFYWGGTSANGNSAFAMLRQPKIERGERRTPWTPSASETIKQSDIVINSDAVRIGSQSIGGDTIGSVLSVSPSGIDFVAEEMRATGDLFVNGDIETMAINAVRADFASVTAEYMSSNIIDSNWLDVDTGLIDRIVSTNAFIDRAEIKAANIRDLTAYDIVGGRLTATNNASEWDLINGNFRMNDADFTLGGGAQIRLTDRNNKIQFGYKSGIIRTAGMGVGVALGDEFPFSYLGTTGDDNLDTLNQYFSGFISNTTARIGEGGANSVSGYRFQIRNEAVDWNKGLDFDLNGSPTIRPYAHGTHELGTWNYRFRRVYTDSVLGHPQVYITNSTANRGFTIDTDYRDGRNPAIYGQYPYENDYDLGTDGRAFYWGYIRELRPPRSGSGGVGSSDRPYAFGHINTLTVHQNFWNNSLREYKENIHDLNLDDAIDFIRGNEIKVFNYKDSDEPSVGLIRDDLVGRDDLVANETAISPNNVQYIAQKVLKHEMYRNDDQDAEIQGLKYRIKELEAKMT